MHRSTAVDITGNSIYDSKKHKNDPLDLWCTVSGINVDVALKFLCPNGQERICPETPRNERINFTDGYTTRPSSWKCRLNIPKVEQEHNGNFSCQVHPHNVTTCQYLKSKELQVVVQQSHEDHDKIIEIIVGLLMSASIVAIVAILGGILCCFIQKYRELIHHEQQQSLLEKFDDSKGG